jgi:uncharacterized protein YbjT (DUF2867 family)
MKYVITGSIGNISKPLTASLVNAGHEVEVISSSLDRKAAIEALGAKALIGDVADQAFLRQAFAGADAVYTMVPPTFAASDWKGHIANIGRGYAEAIAAVGVKKVVNLSSIGAHLPEGCGPVSGLFFVEEALNKLDGVDVLHLRPGFFYTNFLANIGMIKHMGIIGGNYGEGTQLVLSHTDDIAAAAADALLGLDFQGKSEIYLVSDELKTQEIATTLGTAIGVPQLPWIDFKDEDSLGGMMQAGLSEEVARNYVEMGTAMRNGKMAEQYQSPDAKKVQGTLKLGAFAPVFASIYQAG